MATRNSLFASRLFIASGILFTVIGVALVLLWKQISLSLGFRGDTTFIIGATFLLMGIGTLLLSYLRGDLISSDRTFKELYDSLVDDNALSSVSDEVRRMQGEISNLQKVIKKVEGNSVPFKDLTSEDKALLRAEMKSQLEDVLVSDLVKQIEQKYSSKIADDAQVTQIRKGLEITSLRLRQEIAALSRRSNVNLVIGVLTTIIAVGLLAYLVWGSTISFTNLPDILSHFIPRISVAAFIEVFSFFFLKLYKSNLQDIKYFQNELTNIEMKGLALEAALLNEKNKSTEPIIDQLVRTDRNQIPVIASATSSKEAKQLEPKDLADLLDKLSKLLSIGAQK